MYRPPSNYKPLAMSFSPLHLCGGAGWGGYYSQSKYVNCWKLKLLVYSYANLELLPDILEFWLLVPKVAWLLFLSRHQCEFAELVPDVLGRTVSGRDISVGGIPCRGTSGPGLSVRGIPSRDTIGRDIAEPLGSTM